MTKDDIMKLALESGFAKILDEHASEYRNFTFELSQDHYPELGRFIDLVAAHKAVRMPKVGDKVICLEDESLGEVVSLTAGGSPDILFDDGSRGTYMVREFFELFGYVNSHQQQAEPLAWLYPEGLEALQNGKCWTAYPTEHEDCKIPLYTTPQQQQAEPVVWDKPSDNFNDWWDGDRRRDNANPFATDSFAYWAFEGWQAALAQRQWVGLTVTTILNMMPSTIPADYDGELMEFARAVEAKLKEKNHG